MKHLKKQTVGTSLIACLLIVFSQSSSAYAYQPAANCDPDAHLFQWDDNCTITVTPPAPTQDELLTLKVSRIENCVCLPRYSSHEITENAVDIFFEYPEVCLQVFCPVLWGHTVQVGPLSSGVYTVTAHFRHYLPCPSITFYVFAKEPLEVFFPMINR